MASLALRWPVFSRKWDLVTEAHAGPPLDEAATGLLDDVLGRLADDYFRVEVSGLENVPRSGPALVIANHSGAWGLDAFVLHKLLRREIGRAHV